MKNIILLGLALMTFSCDSKQQLIFYLDDKVSLSAKDRDDIMRDLNEKAAEWNACPGGEERHIRISNVYGQGIPFFVVPEHDPSMFIDGANRKGNTFTRGDQVEWIKIKLSRHSGTIAHELGHAFLNPGRHAETGIMSGDYHLYPHVTPEDCAQLKEKKEDD